MKLAKKLPPFFSELNIHQSQIFQIVVVMIEDPTMTSLLQYLGADIPGIRAVKILHALQTNGLKSDHAKLLGNFFIGQKTSIWYWLYRNKTNISTLQNM